MHIRNFHWRESDQDVGYYATVTWEDRERPDQELHFRVRKEHRQYLAGDPQAFLVAAITPAMHTGERRVMLDEPIGPELADNLKTAMAILTHWYGEQMPLTSLDVVTQTAPPQSDRRPVAGMFLSGGVDSLTLLRHNHLTFATSHPRFMKAALFVHGFDIGAFESGAAEYDSYDRALAALMPIANDAGISLIPVYTNVRHLDDAVPSWMSYYHGAALSSVAHAMSGVLTSVSIASSFTLGAQRPWGSSPLLDPYFSSENLRIRHENLRFSRLQKVSALSDWPVAVENLRVCTNNPVGLLNCGQCEKCRRTMLELLAVGRLEQATAFPERNLTADQLAGLQIRTAYQRDWYVELIEPLEAQGRQDLTAVIRSKLEDLNSFTAWQEERDWKGAIKRLDRKYLGSAMIRTYAAARGLLKGSG